ncbi:MAG: S-layer homology domain-containing protein [Candidatus Melainabacteria bacterium]|nr:S-layer homology domain-containing protein [Candidatus Melainabacteria bacterium]
MTFKLTVLPIILTGLIFTFFTSSKSAYGQAAKQRDATVVAINELPDVESDVWAFNAVKELVEKYDVLEGYPDNTYKGKKPTTRFELAAAVYDLATYFSDEIGQDRDDLAKLAKLLDEFSNELKTIQTRVDELQGKITAIDTRTTALEEQVAKQKTQLEEHDKRLAYAERKKGFLFERVIKGLFIDFRDLSRGLTAAIGAPFSKDIK